MNAVTKLIHCLRICPESDFVTRAIHLCDDNGNISDEELNKQLSNVVLYGKEYSELFSDLVALVEQSLTFKDSDLFRLGELDLLVGTHGVSNINRLVRWTKFKNKVSK